MNFISYGFPALVEPRKDENLGEKATLGERTRRHGACRAAVERMADAFEAAHQDFRPVAVGDALGNPAFSNAAHEHLARLAKGHRLRLSPATSGTDGFFAALYERAG